jgi:hypothetical protein
MELHTIGIDLGKTVFHLVGVNLRGEVVVRKKFSRKQLLRFTANLKVELIGMEACGGAHFLGRALREQGHEAFRLRHSRPFLKAAPLPIAAMIAVAVTGPMPGIATSRRQASFSPAVFLITASASSIRICK